MPFISGQDCGNPSVKSIIGHEQYSTIFKDTRDLAKVSAGMVDAIVKGGTPEVNDTKTYNNKVKIVPSYLLKPVRSTRPTGSRSWSTAATTSSTSFSKRTENKPPRRPARRLFFFALGPASRDCGRLTPRNGQSLRMPAILEMRGITKKFPGVVALRDVNLSVEEGEIHAICGENGAGKSTLMKVLSGVYPGRLL